MEQVNTTFSLTIAPYLAMPWIWGMIGGALLLCIFALITRRRATIARTLIALGFCGALLAPMIQQEQRSPVNDTVAIIMDQSDSQTLGQRRARMDAMEDHLTQRITALGGFETRIIPAPTANGDQRTDLFDAMQRGLSDIPAKQRAGVIIITDGQVHDVPPPQTRADQMPIHTILTGERDERDRAITLTHAPAYGVVGDVVTARFILNDTPTINVQTARVTIRNDNGETTTRAMQVGVEHSIDIPISTPSENIITLSVEDAGGELTLANNTRHINVNGVRNRLKVMLISGTPYQGERTWRNILTSDAGIDLVHFTILRDPQKRDATPQSELSLIAFPFQELFEHKIKDFDLIIFDRYRVNNILPPRYFRNIVDFVREGGAFLASVGPDYVTDSSIHNTALADILPAAPAGAVDNAPFRPALTDYGRAHPVTESLAAYDTWGAWLRHVPVTLKGGDIVMAARDNPLLIFDRVDDGRVAMLASDQIWLWSRGYDGGGPHADLLRRVVHWLMKEPDLEDNKIRTQVTGNTITITMHHMHDTLPTLTVSTPEGLAEDIALTASADTPYSLRATYHAATHGLYRFTSNTGGQAVAMVGDLDTEEWRTITSTDTHIAPIVQETGGALLWADKTPSPKITATDSSTTRHGGKDWIGLKRNGEYTVSGVNTRPLWPVWMSVLALLLASLLLWWYEGRR